MENSIVLQNEEALSHPEEMRMKLRDDSAVKQLAARINRRDQIDLLEFGKEAAQGISKFADSTLNAINSDDVTNSSMLIKQLDKLMDKFDKKELQPGANAGFFDKMFNQGKGAIEKIVGKYTTMGAEIDRIHTEISKYEINTKKSTQTLEELYIENFKYYVELEKHIVAGKMVLEEWREELRLMNDKQGDMPAQMEASSFSLLVELLEQRVNDLEMAQQVSFLQAPQIRMLQKSNNKLVAKINSAFVVTLPIFKMGLITAIDAKKQALIADSMDALDKRTNEMLLKNARNIAQQSVANTKLAGQASIKVETLEEAYNTIAQGIKDTLAMEEENRKQRQQGSEKIRELQEKFTKTSSRMLEQGRLLEDRS